MEILSRDVVVFSAWESLIYFVTVNRLYENLQLYSVNNCIFSLVAILDQIKYNVCYCFFSFWLFPDWNKKYSKIHFLLHKIAYSQLNSQNCLKTGNCICFSKWFTPSCWPVLSSTWCGRATVPAPCARSPSTWHSWSWQYSFMLHKREWNAHWSRGGTEYDTCQMSHLALLQLAGG